ncbi:helicase HerA domain-containing protein [Rhodococcus sp. NPDC055024]
MTPEERAALESIRLSWAPTPEDVWSPQTDLHVQGLHEHAMADVMAAFRDGASGGDASPLGVVVHGPAGSGKTHLLGQVREQVQRKGGYFFLIRLLDAEDFWRSVLVGMLEDLGRPAVAHPTQLVWLLSRLADEAKVDDTVRHSILGAETLTSESLEAFVAALYRAHPRHRRSSQHTLRALVLLSSAEPAIQDTGDAYLQSIDSVDTAEFSRWGIRVANLGHQGIAENISRLLAITGPTVLAVDQIDTLVAQSRQGSDHEDYGDEDLLVEKIAHGLMALRETMCRTASVVSCLSAAWELISTRATASVQDRFRRSATLERIPSSDIGRSLLARRFAAGYQDLGFVPDYPTWPITESAFIQAPNYTPRQLLVMADKHIRSCLSADQVSELHAFDETPAAEASSRGSVQVIGDQISEDGFATFDRRFAELIAKSTGSVLQSDLEDSELPALLADGLTAWIHECQLGDDVLTLDAQPGAKPALHARMKHLPASEAEEHWSYRSIAATNAVAVLNRIQKASAAAGLDPDVANRRLFLIRNHPWPTGAKTAATVQAFEKAGGRTVRLSSNDEAILHAIRGLLRENAPGLESWLLARKPAHGVELFDETLGGIDRETDEASPVPVRTPTGVPTPTDLVEPEPALAPHSVPIGTTVGSNRQISVQLEALRKHTAIFAGSGSGKTVLIRRLVEECALQGVSSIIIDPNNDLTRLGTAWPAGSRQWQAGDEAKAAEYLEHTEVLVWTPRRAGGRPLSLQALPDFASILDDPDELDAAVDSAVAALAPRAGAVGSGTRPQHLRAVLTQTVGDFARRSQGSLADLIDLLENLPDGTSDLRNAAALAADLAENLKASTANDPLFGGSGSPMDPGLLLTPTLGKRARVSVVNLSGLSSDEQRHGFVNQLQMALFAWIKKNPAGDRPLGGLFVMDEAQNFAPSGKTVASTESTLALASQARKYGLGLVFATQAPKGLHNRIPGNAATQFYGLLNSPAQIESAKEMARVKGGQVDDIGRLPTGQFYAAIEGSGFQKTQTPLCLTYHPKSPPTEEEVLALARGELTVTR